MRAPLDVPDLAELAARLGLTVGRGGFGPCPGCGAARRGAGDPRVPVGVYGAGRDRWRCQAGGCDAGGDAVALLAYVRCGENPGAGDPRWPAILAELRGADPVPVSRTSPRPPPPVAATVEGPAPAEVAALWAACSPLDKLEDNDPALRWLRCRRGLSVEGIAALDLARALPAAGKLPAWVPSLGIERATWRAVYRLAAPVYNARGELAALRFRAVDRYPLDTPPPGCRVEDRNGRAVLVAPLWTPPGEPVRGDTVLSKALAARGVGNASGLVLADPLGVALLRGKLEDEGMRWDRRVVIVEGETDLWRVATPRVGRGANGESYAAFGVEAGSWTAEHAARIPDGARVLVATDDDDAGNVYAATIAATLTGRCKLKRTKRSNDADKV